MLYPATDICCGLQSEKFSFFEEGGGGDKKQTNKQQQQQDKIIRIL
jgi:hypothetical protein